MKRVLILEDSIIVSKLLASLLRAKGFQVTECASVSQAKSNLKGLDLAILDYRLPDGTGLEIAEELKKNRPDIPIFLLTARGSHVSEDVASKAGIKKYLEKPVEPETLMEHIDEFLMPEE
ncbi:MAG: response regulator [Thermodesulfobacteria bacterium]|nr:response regulator [Thermodesulfobacteriota bacterium]